MLGGRRHMAIEVERQLVTWTSELFGFPPSSTGLFVTGTSIANFLGVLVARTRALGSSVRGRGLTGTGRLLTAYTSTAAHGCIARAMEMAGLGQESAPSRAGGRGAWIQIAALRRAIADDRDNGLQPFLLIGTAGTVDVGAIDDLPALAAIANSEQLHFHVDGAFGALAILAPELAPRLGRDRTGGIRWRSIGISGGRFPYDCRFSVGKGRRIAP